MTSDEKKRLSISQIDMLNRCGEQYRRRYIHGERIPPGISLLVGRATDDSVSRNLQNKIDTGELLEQEEVETIAAEAMATSFVTQEVLFSDEEIQAGIKKVKGQAVDKAVRLSGLHHRSCAPNIEPTHVQRKWVIELENYPMNLTGVIDVQEGLKSVRDTKTSGKSPNADAANDSDQLTMYAMAGKVLDGTIPESLILDYLVDTKKPKVVTLVTERTAEDFTPMLARIENAMAAIDRGVFIPCPQTFWLCNPKFCGYANTCAYYRKGAKRDE